MNKKPFAAAPLILFVAGGGTHAPAPCEPKPGVEFIACDTLPSLVRRHDLPERHDNHAPLLYPYAIATSTSAPMVDAAKFMVMPGGWKRS